MNQSSWYQFDIHAACTW